MMIRANINRLYNLYKIEKRRINYFLALITTKLLIMSYGFFFAFILLTSVSCNQNAKNEAAKDMFNYRNCLIIIMNKE